MNICSFLFIYSSQIVFYVLAGNLCGLSSELYCWCPYKHIVPRKLLIFCMPLIYSWFKPVLDDTIFFDICHKCSCKRVNYILSGLCMSVVFVFLSSLMIRFCRCLAVITSYSADINKFLMWYFFICLLSWQHGMEVCWWLFMFILPHLWFICWCWQLVSLLFFKLLKNRWVFFGKILFYVVLSLVCIFVVFPDGVRGKGY